MVCERKLDNLCLYVFSLCDVVSVVYVVCVFTGRSRGFRIFA